MQKNHFLLLNKFKNTESAQLCKRSRTYTNLLWNVKTTCMLVTAEVNLISVPSRHVGTSKLD